MNYKLLTFSTVSDQWAGGERVGLLPDGRLELAAGDDPGIGVTIGNSSSFRAHVQFRRPAIERRVIGPANAGVGLIETADGCLTPSATDPTAILLAPLAASGTACVMPLRAANRAGVPKSASANLNVPLPPAAPSSRSPGGTTPASDQSQTMKKAKTYTGADPIGDILQRRSDLVAAGFTPQDAMTKAFSEDPSRQASYAQVVRSNPGALAAGYRAEVDRRAALKMKSGMSRSDAIFAVYREDPDLQRHVAGRPESQLVDGAAPATRSRRAIEAEINAAIDPMKARGMGHAEAVCRLFKDRPDLQAEYIQSANSGRRVG